MLVIEHFGRAPPLDVQFAFAPPLANHEGKPFANEPPFSTRIAAMEPRFYRDMEFDDYYPFQNHAGLTRIGRSLRPDIKETQLDFEATVTLRDPIRDDQRYETRYALDLRDLMGYAMYFRAAEEGATEAAQ